MDAAKEMVAMKHAIFKCDSDDSQVDSVALIDNANLKNKNETGTGAYVIDTLMKESPTEWYALIQAEEKLKKV